MKRSPEQEFKSSDLDAKCLLSSVFGWASSSQLCTLHSMFVRVREHCFEIKELNMRTGLHGSKTCPGGLGRDGLRVSLGESGNC